MPYGLLLIVDVLLYYSGMTDTDPSLPIHIRVPADLHKKLKEAAANNERSLPKEILFRLKASVKK